MCAGLATLDGWATPGGRVKISKLAAATALCIAAEACASSHASRPAPGAGPVAELDAPPPSMVFTGKFSPVINVTSGSGMASGATRINGTVRLIGAPGLDDQFTVEADFTTDRGAETLLWSIVEGGCGNASLPLVPPRQLLPIEVPATGQVHVTTQFRSTMVQTAAYHFNLYAGGGSDLSAVIGCASLRG
jgi:hypothetical protein